MDTLSLRLLGELPAAVARPAYDPRRVGIGIVHLGLGAFHRAHQAIYLDELLGRVAGDWGICGVSLRTEGVVPRLRTQDNLYTAVEKSQAGARFRVIGSVREALVLETDRPVVTERLAAAATRLVTLTVTEKGYCHRPATGSLDFEHPDVLHDLADPANARSAVGVLVHALEVRRRSHGQPVSVVSCDNLPHNGAVTRGLVAEFAHALDAGLAQWISEHVAFPSTMVDRIVPATTAEDEELVRARCGHVDRAPVVHEPFAQWVIENAFATPRPDWEQVGVQMVGDVAPFEAMKLRLLNASHSMLAYLGYLAGHVTIYQVVAVPHFERVMRNLMAEVEPSLDRPPSIDLGAYRQQLVERFGNPALPHRTWQIAMDGSQKLPQRLLATVRDNLARRRPVSFLALAIAGWMRYVRGTDDAGRPIDIRDPLAAELARVAAVHAGDPEGYVRALLGFEAVFGADLANAPGLVEPVLHWYRQLDSKGADITARRAALTAAPPT